MKKMMILLIAAGLLVTQARPAAAQIKDPVKEVEKEGENRVNRGIDKTIDKGFDKIEEGIGSLFKKGKKDKNAKKEEAGKSEQAGTPSASSEQKAGAALNWAKYDFIPGDRVIFEDNQTGEENGEFPSRWDLKKGDVEIVEFGGENVIRFMSGASSIIPYLKNPGKDYLPDVFTIEMDVFFDSSEQPEYIIALHDLKNQTGSGLHYIVCLPGGIRCQGTDKAYSGLNLWNKQEESHWRHIAIGFNIRSLKVYFDDERLINIPNLGWDPTGVTVSISNAVSPQYFFIKNIRIAEGGQKLYDRFLQDGKIISNGIRFDVNMATLKPESMGIINEIATLMKEHPDINFSVEGHTDSDGDSDFNQTLSEQRAATVVSTLMKLGIDSNRMTSIGWGESSPVDSNATPEGKANNRRVEFVKM